MAAIRYKQMVGALATVTVTCAAGCNADRPFSDGGAPVAVAKGEHRAWNFDTTAIGGLPSDFVLVQGQWATVADPTAPSQPRALQQTGVHLTDDLSRVLVKSLTWKDFSAAVRCKPISGANNRSCGLMVRVQDSDNYYLARADASDNTVSFYRFVDGEREQIEIVGRPIAANEWHLLQVEAHGGSFFVRADGQNVITTADPLFSSGKVGLWTKGDAVIAYDDLTVDAL